MKIPAAIRWLDWMVDVGARFSEGGIEAPSVTFPVPGDVTFSRPQKSGSRLLGRRYRAEAFEERPNALCGHCGRWGHIEARYTRDGGCAFCSEEHHTGCHECPVEGCSARKAEPTRTSPPGV